MIGLFVVLRGTPSICNCTCHVLGRAVELPRATAVSFVSFLEVIGGVYSRDMPKEVD